VDTIHRANVHAGGIFDPDTGFGNDEDHSSHVPRRRRNLTDGVDRLLPSRSRIYLLNRDTYFVKESALGRRRELNLTDSGL